MALPPHGRPAAEVFADLDRSRGEDVRWREGRAFSLVYHAGDDVLGVAQLAYAAFGSENALNVDAFPSLRRMQNEVVDAVTGWLHGPESAAGFLTSGGTESILMAVLAARERGRRERGVERPNMVLAASAHAAFEKAAHYFGVRSVRVPVRADWRADVDAMGAAIDDDTVLLVASTPQYPQGVLDQVEPIAVLAAERAISCHVDACMGGVVLPYLERLGEQVAPWDFRVEGVTSISVDLHKFGYTAKGASVIAYRDRALRADQTFVTDNWLGGRYGSSGVLGTKSGGPVAAAWAVLQHLGDDGYLRLAGAARRATLALAEAIADRPGLVLRAWPDTTLVAFGVAGGGVARFDEADLAAALARRGWYVDRQGPPPSLHCTVNAVHDGRVDAFVADLDAACEECADAATDRDGPGGGSADAGRYGTIE